MGIVGKAAKIFMESVTNPTRPSVVVRKGEKIIALSPMAKLAGADLSGIKLIDVDLHGIDLKGANLENAILVNVNLSKADLTDVNLKSATLSNVDLKDAKVGSVNLVKTVMSADVREQLQGAVGAVV